MEVPMDPLVLFITTFLAVFFGELGDKSQMVSALGALRNYHHRFVVFLASTSALVLLTGLAVWFTTLVPSQWVAILSCLGGFLKVVSFRAAFFSVVLSW